MNPTTFQAYRDAVARQDAAQAAQLLEKLVEEGSPFVHRHAARLAKGDLPDLMQAGRIAYWKAIEEYDSSRGGFAGFAKKKVLSFMMRYVVATRAQVSSSAKWTPMTKETRRAYQAFAAKYGRQPSAADLGVDAAVFEAQTKPARFTPYEETDDGSISGSTCDVPLVMSKELLRALSSLPQREWRIFMARVDGDSFGDIGAVEGISKQHAARVYEDAVATLKEILVSKAK